ncbi:MULTISPECIES: hypothetical protein [unclassified Acidovorax]|uniref:hypothetical protein n=1 Tax=unclassified Acidovorax TaxID=2684926 RepID=UPI000AA55D8E|nr:MULTISPECIES: hypothetical protein [unclassified Acidovorax]
MMYFYKDKNGHPVYSDRMPSPNETTSPVTVTLNGIVVKTESAPKSPHDEAKGYIADARKHIPKTIAYIDYVEYLRKNNPVRHHQYMMDIKKNDPKTFVKLTQARIFQPLQPHQRLSNMLDAGTSVLGDLFAGRSSTGTAATYAEKTLTDYMKKDGFIPGSVLGNKATTLPEKIPTYSNTRLGQWSQKESERLAKASKAAQTAVSGRPVLTSAGMAATRVGGSVLDAMIGALEPSAYAGFSALLGTAAIEKDLQKKGIILWPEEKYYLTRHLAGKDWEAARNIIKEAAVRRQSELTGQK